jgi:predicted phage-related endonuclease
MIIFHDVEQGSPEWHALRKDLWTGSKAIRLLQGKPLPRDYEFGGNIYTRRGHALEAVAILEYERQVGRRVMRPGFVTNTVYKNAGYSPDGIERRVLLEVKALNGERHDKLAAGDIPLEFLVQIYFGMIITGLRKAKLLAFNPECEQQLTVLEVVYDKAIGNNIRNKLKLDMKHRLLLGPA